MREDDFDYQAQKSSPYDSHTIFGVFWNHMIALREELNENLYWLKTLMIHTPKSLLTKAWQSECAWIQSRSKKKNNTTRSKKLPTPLSKAITASALTHWRDVTRYYLSRSNRSSSAPGSLRKPAHRCSCRCHPPSLPVWRASLRSVAHYSSTAAHYTPAHPQAKRNREKL